MLYTEEDMNRARLRAFLLGLLITLTVAVGLSILIPAHPKTEVHNYTAIVQMPTATPQPTTTPSESDAVALDGRPMPPAVQVYPAAGKLHGVVKHGTSLNDHPETWEWNNGLGYTCASGLQSVHVGYLNTIEYNGDVIGMDERDYYGFGLDEQSDALLNLTGTTAQFRTNLIAVIVNTSDAYAGIHHDDRAVNVYPDMLGDSQWIQFHTPDFVSGGYVEGFTLCVK